MTTTNDGGAAFPVPHLMTLHGEICNAGATGGMSLRDYFAGQAMTGAIASMANPHADISKPVVWKQMASSCYEAADAMLVARERSRDGQ